MANTSFAQLISEFKASPRLRVGAWFCLAILWFYGILHVQETIVAKGKEYEALVKRSARAHAIADQKIWHVRLDDARAVEKSLASLLWREQTQGLAQAAFQDWLVQTLQQAAISKPQLTVVAQEGPKPSGGSKNAEEIWKISARVAFDFNPKTFSQFVDKLAGREKWIVLETLNVRSSPSPRAEMTLVTYFAKAKE